MGVFRSRLEDLVEVKEVDFEQHEAFGRYKVFFPDEAIAHPAKAYTDVLEWIIKRYTKPGDIILDPMAGTGSTGVVVALHGRHAILVDIEERFVEWMNKAKELVEKHQTLTPKGKITVIHGDARKLSQLLRERISTIITSPPYSGTINKHAGGPTGQLKVRVGESTLTARAYGESEANIGNLPHGDIDVIITSPPYSEALSVSSGGTNTVSYTHLTLPTN